MLGQVSLDDGGLPPLELWPLRRPRAVGPLNGGRRNVSVLVEDAAGSRYVLRGCRRNPSRDRITFQLSFQEHLRGRGVPVPEIIASLAGERCVETGPGSLWVLSRFAGGHHYVSRADDRAELLAAARCLADLHAAGATFTAAAVHAAAAVHDRTIPDLRG